MAYSVNEPKHTETVQVMRKEISKLASILQRVAWLNNREVADAASVVRKAQHNRCIRITNDFCGRVATRELDVTHPGVLVY